MTGSLPHGQLASSSNERVRHAAHPLLKGERTEPKRVMRILVRRDLAIGFQPKSEGPPQPCSAPPLFPYVTVLTLRTPTSNPRTPPLCGMLICHPSYEI